MSYICHTRSTTGVCRGLPNRSRKGCRGSTHGSPLCREGNFHIRITLEGRLSMYFSVTRNPSRAVTLPNIRVPHYIGVPQRVIYPMEAPSRRKRRTQCRRKMRCTGSVPPVLPRCPMRARPHPAPDARTSVVHGLSSQIHSQIRFSSQMQSQIRFSSQIQSQIFQARSDSRVVHGLSGQIQTPGSSGWRVLGQLWRSVWIWLESP